MAVKIPSKLHTMSPTFQKAWYKRNKMELPTHLTGSVKQASKEIKPSERVKKLQTKSLQAYGATKGLKVGGEHGSEEMKDTIAPLTRDQHSKVQAAARAAKKTPLTKDQRMAAIAAAVRKAQTKHDVPTIEPDEGHDDLRDLHQSLHIRKGYNEEVELDEASKAEAEKLLGGPVKTRTGNEPKGKLPLGFRRARNLARQAMKGGVSAIHRSMEKTMQKENVTESTTEVNEMSSHGKALAKAIMAKQSKRPIAQQMGEAIKDQADVGEYDYEGDMAKSQLRSIMTNAKRMHDMLEDNTNLPEWVQSKITLAEDYILTAANYMEGEMNEEVEMVDEKINLVKAKMGDVIKDFQKSDAPQFKGKSMEKRREMAIAAKLGAEREVKEEVEQIDELKKSTLASYVNKAARQVRSKSGIAASFETQGERKRDPEKKAAYLDAAQDYRVGARKRLTGIEKATSKLAKEEVEQVEEKYMGFKKVMAAAKEGGARDPAAVAASIGRKKYGKEKFQAMAAAGKRAANEETEIVAEAEGSVPTTPKEKDLAAHHGDPNKITYGDVIKARLKSAAAKKMGK